MCPVKSAVVTMSVFVAYKHKQNMILYTHSESFIQMCNSKHPITDETCGMIVCMPNNFKCFVVFFCIWAWNHLIYLDWSRLLVTFGLKVLAIWQPTKLIWTWGLKGWIQLECFEFSVFFNFRTNYWTVPPVFCVIIRALEVWHLFKLSGNCKRALNNWKK